jgi:hypothetical protein
MKIMPKIYRLSKNPIMAEPMATITDSAQKCIFKNALSLCLYAT